MFDRIAIKASARDVISKSYWKCLLISLIISISIGSSGGSSTNNAELLKDNGYLSDILNPTMTLIIVIILFALAFFALAFRIFLGYILEVGGRKFYIATTEDYINMNLLGFGFNNNHYMSIVGSMLLKGVYNNLWYFLLIVPGIIKSYSYAMVPYILADNPKIGASRAIELSNQMTRGEKFNMFVLDLSFIGWYILGFLALFIGVIFVRPYHDAAKAQLYKTFRDDAIKYEYCSADELNMPIFQNPESDEYDY